MTQRIGTHAMMLIHYFIISRMCFPKVKTFSCFALITHLNRICSGTMAGGGNTVIKGLMSKVTCDIDPKEVDKMSDEINNDQRRVRHYSFRIVFNEFFKRIRTTTLH